MSQALELAMVISRYIHGGRNYVDFLRKLGTARLILSAGMPRSGSTLLFNILRVALTHKDNRVVSGWIGDIKNLPNGSTYIIKVHHVGWHRALRAQAMFYTYRDIRDALVSNKRKFGTASIELVHDWIREYEFARKRAMKMIRYEDMMQSLSSVVLEVLDDLELRLSVEEVLSGLPKDDAPTENQSYSKESLLHTGHRTNTVSGDWREELDTELQEQIHAQFSWWLELNEYPV